MPTTSSIGFASNAPFSVHCPSMKYQVSLRALGVVLVCVGGGGHWGKTRPECSRADQLGGELGKTRPESSRADLRRPHRELHPTHAPGGYSHYGGCSHTHPPVVVPLVQLHAVDHLLRQGQLHALVGRPEARRQNLEREKGTEGTVRRRREKKAQGAWRKG